MMMNPLGIIQNNQGITEFIKYLKNSEKQYELMSKEDERKMVGEYVEIKKDENGNDILDKKDKLYKKYINETDEEKKKNLYYMVRRELVWKKPEHEFTDLLVMHNIRLVFNMSKKYCKGTKDFDNMVEKGLYGLVKAANKFNPYSPMVKYANNATEEDKRKRRNKVVIFDEDGKIDYIKFCTYARNWIFKYMVQEFQDKRVKLIDNMSISLNDAANFKNVKDSKHTVGEYIDSMVAPEYKQQKTIDQTISDVEASEFYDKIHDYIVNTNELTSIEKEIVTDIYYNGMKTRDIAEKMNVNVSIISENKNTALKKIKSFMMNRYNINSINELC